MLTWTTKDARRARPFTTQLLEASDEGALDKDTLIADLLGYMSEAEVEDFVRKNDMLYVIGMEEDEDESEEEEGEEV